MLDALKNEVFPTFDANDEDNSVERARRVLFPFYHGWSDYDAIPSEEFEYGGKHYFRTYLYFLKCIGYQGDDNGVVQNLYLNKNTDLVQKLCEAPAQASNNVHLAPKEFFDSFEKQGDDLRNKHGAIFKAFLLSYSTVLCRWKQKNLMA